MDYEADIINAGAEIIWVMEQTPTLQPGTADNCRSWLDFIGSTDGTCVGDSQTQPVPGTFDNSPFSIARGFDIIVVRETMEIVWVTTHGTPSGNENIAGADVLAEVQAVIAGL